MPNGHSQQRLRRRRLPLVPDPSAMFVADSSEPLLGPRDSVSYGPLSDPNSGQLPEGYLFRKRPRFSEILLIITTSCILFIAGIAAAIATFGTYFVTTSSIPLTAWPHSVARPPRLASDGAVLRVLSYNTFMRPVPVGTLDYQAERMPLIVDAVAAHGIATTQEMFWLSGRKKAFLGSLRQRGIPFYTAAPMPGLKGLMRWPPKLIDGGLTITSEFPIVETDFITYDSAVLQSIDYIVAKGALYAKIQLPGHSDGQEQPLQTCVHVFTTHAQANNGLDPQVFMSVRHDQIAQLAHFVLSKITSGSQKCPVIIGGDFNVDARVSAVDSRSSTEYNETIVLLENRIPGLSDMLFEANMHRHPVTSAGGLDGKTQKNERLDYIFFAKSPAVPGFSSSSIVPPAVKEFLTPQLFPVRTASDHYGVSVAFDYL